MAELPGFAEWMSSLEERHLADLTFPELSRALRALSSTYVERRGRIREGAALSGAGKRAAFALFYGPLHFLLVHHIVGCLPELRNVEAIVDLGCGTGAAGAAWAAACPVTPVMHGIDRHPWAVEETRETWRVFGLNGRARVEDIARVAFPEKSGVVAAFAINELSASTRDRLLPRLLSHAERGGRVLIVEPLAGFVAPWWPTWERAFQSSGGHSKQWRISIALPAIVEKLDKAARLNHRELTGRSLIL